MERRLVGDIGPRGRACGASGTTGHKTYSILDCWHDYNSNPTRVCTFDIPAGTVTSQVYDPKSSTWRSGTNANFSDIEWTT